MDLLTWDGRIIGGQETDKWPDGSLRNRRWVLAEELGDNQTMYFVNYDNAYHIRDPGNNRKAILRGMQ